jgi:hypothetical protein
MKNFLMIGSPVDIRPTLERWYRDFYESWPAGVHAAEDRDGRRDAGTYLNHS